MAITWFRSRNPGRHAGGYAAAPSADRTEQAGQQAALGSPVAYDASYDRAGWDGAERELLMPAAAGSARPPWETGTVPAALRATGPAEPDLSELTLTDKPLDVLRPETAPERTPAGPGLAAAPQARPYAPQDSGPPVTGYMLAILGSVTIGSDPLAGKLPYFAGDRTDDQGRRLAGVTLGSGTKAWEVFETSRVDVLDALEAAVRQARDTLVYGGLPDAAAPADPEAAEHREALERELDGCLEQARGILRAAGNLGFISGALRQRNGEGVMDVFVARAALANLIEGGDGAAAMDAARAFVGIISKLCSDEVARAIANGIVPSDEAVARAGEAPEPDAADDPEAADGTERELADSQDGPAAA